MQTPTSVGAIVGDGGREVGAAALWESGPDFMMLMSSREYEGLLINEFVI